MHHLDTLLIRSGFAPLGDGDRFVRSTRDGVRIVVASGVVAGRTVRDKAIVRVECNHRGSVITDFRRAVPMMGRWSEEDLLEAMRQAWRVARAR